MSHLDIIRAWKDAEYRQSLSAAERATLPEHPAGPIELNDDELDDAAGGLPIYTLGTLCRSTLQGTQCLTYARCSTQSLCATYGPCPTTGWCPSVNTRCIPV